MNLGEKINELRKKKQLTQEMLAERLCVSPQAVSKWERGVANPDLYLIPNQKHFGRLTLRNRTLIPTESKAPRTAVRGAWFCLGLF